MAPVASLHPDTSFKHWIASDLRFFRERDNFSLAQMGRIIAAASTPCPTSSTPVTAGT